MPRTTEKAAHSLDVRAIVKALGGRQEVVRKLSTERMGKITLSAVDKWLDRENIPVDRLCDLLILSKREREPINIFDHISKRSE